MNSRIVLFNIVFYLITLTFYFQGRQDPSSSLGVGFLIIGFWFVALVTLLIFLAKKIIRPKSTLDKIGIITATPLLFVVSVGIILIFNDTPSSESYFDKDNHRYKEVTYNHFRTSYTKRIEYYKSLDTIDTNGTYADVDKWVRDSSWIYISRNGDTTKIVKYKNDIEIK